MVLHRLNKTSEHTTSPQPLFTLKTYEARTLSILFLVHNELMLHVTACNENTATDIRACNHACDIGNVYFSIALINIDHYTISDAMLMWDRKCFVVAYLGFDAGFLFFFTRIKRRQTNLQINVTRDFPKKIRQFI